MAPTSCGNWRATLTLSAVVSSNDAGKAGRRDSTAATGAGTVVGKDA